MNTIVNPFNYQNNGHLSIHVNSEELILNDMLDIKYEFSLYGEEPYMNVYFCISKILQGNLNIEKNLLIEILKEVENRFYKCLNLKNSDLNSVLLESYLTTNMLKVAYLGDEKEPFDKSKVVVLMMILNSNRHEFLTSSKAPHIPKKLLSDSSILNQAIATDSIPGFVYDGIYGYVCDKDVNIYDLCVLIPHDITEESCGLEIIPIHLNPILLKEVCITKPEIINVNKIYINDKKTDPNFNEYRELIEENTYMYAPGLSVSFVSLLHQLYKIMWLVTNTFNKTVREKAIHSLIADVLLSGDDNAGIKTKMFFMATEMFADKNNCLGFKPEPTDLGLVYKKHVEILSSLYADKSDAIEPLIKTAYFNRYPDVLLEL